MQAPRALPKQYLAARHGKTAVWRWYGQALALALSLLLPSIADADDGVELARHLVEQGRILPLEQLLTRAQDLRAGIPLEVELHAEDDASSYVYEIEMLDREGAVWSVAFDAKTGQLIHLDAEED